MLKRIAKTARDLALAGLVSGPRLFRTNGLLILMYHRVLPPDDERAGLEQPGMLVHPVTFENHLRLVRRYLEPIMLSDWLHGRAVGKNIPGRACAITFDDGWSDNYEFAFPLLKTFQIPATIFLVADQIDATATLWPERLARIIAKVKKRNDRAELLNSDEFSWLSTEFPELALETGVGPDLIDNIIVFAKNQYSDVDLRVRTRKMTDVLGDNKPDKNSMLSWAQIEEMQSSKIIEFGSHTCSHQRLTAELNEATLNHEIIQSRVLLENQLATTVDLFCYPNGDTTPQSVDVVRNNYAAAVTTERGWNNSNSDLALLKRVGIHQGNSATDRAFLARLSGYG